MGSTWDPETQVLHVCAAPLKTAIYPENYKVEENDEQALEEVKGSHSTKVEAVVRTLKRQELIILNIIIHMSNKRL